MKIDVCFLGRPEVRIDGVSVKLEQKKFWALLLYVLYNGSATRDELAEFLWCDYAEESARRNLRNSLYMLKAEISYFFESNSIYVHSAAGGASSASIRPSSSFSQSSRRSAQSVSLTAWSFSSSKSSRRKTRLVADRQYFPRSKSLYARLVM